MSENVKNGILIAVAALTIINTGIILTEDDGVSYEKTAIDQSSTSPNANAVNNQTPDQQLAAQQQNNQQANVVKPPAGPKTKIKFTETEYDFGEVKQNTRNPKVFTFKNTGDEPLIISNAKGSCGCTVPRYPREPIPPGETGEIEVVYSPGSQKNRQTKTVTITANTEPATSVLKITANVVPDENATGGNNQPDQTIQVGS